MRCLALFTGGLDSQIAVRLLQRQGIEVIGVQVGTPFTGAAEGVSQIADRLGIELRRLEWGSDYLELIARPRFGFAEEMAPCLDCRSGMVRRVRELLEPLGASFLISGEVVGQRPSSLRSRDLETIAYHGAADDLLLRPLSALLLPPTLPERDGWVDRSQFLGWHGRGRREQLQLAREWDLVEAEDHAPGCALLEPTYAARLRRVLLQDSSPPGWQLATLKFGRHFWCESRAHLILSKNAAEGEELRRIYSQLQQANEERAMLLEPRDFRGPVALLTGALEAQLWFAAINVLRRYAKETTERSFVEMSLAGRVTLRVPLSGASEAYGVNTEFVP
jgi:tRNA-specific 2-thiouridylase